jgi:hypothetical protein
MFVTLLTQHNAGTLLLDSLHARGDRLGPQCFVFASG